MRASFERSELLRLLGPVTKVVEARNTIPVLGNVLLAVTPSADGITDGSVSVTGTDLDIRITNRGAAKVAEGGAVTVSASKLGDIVRKLPTGADVSISIEPNNLIVKSGRSRFKLPTLPAEDFPDITVGEFTTTFTTDLAALFKPVSFAISTEETRFYLNGIYLHAVDGKLRAVATDGHRLAQHDGAAAESFPGVIVPRKVVGLVPPGEIDVSISSTKVRFVSDALEVVSKVIDATYPDYQRVIPRDNAKVASVDRAALFAAADRVSTISSERGRSVKLSFADGSLALSVKSDEGSAEDELAVGYDAEPLEIGFNASYLRDVLGTFGDESVLLRLNDASSPAVIDAGGPMLCALMPMRVS
ncbi:DNA polymerase III subunit beta [Bosea sp. FBZP-16]|uniref:DNA polymerase III subunit beta n=1 Tax=Bosea sp. FBZP-16 TaxID=2065382 RepID=UPI000C300264|nr:DNA polymerase III subunit beta [Bosea sp. FBZP-16]